MAVWPSASVSELLRDRLPAQTEDLSWVAPDAWHVTLAFLGEVAQAAAPELIQALSVVGSELPPTTASIGPETRRLGSSVLCVPVEGLGALAHSVRAVAGPFGRWGGLDPEMPFFGHLTVARARRHQGVAEPLVGRSVYGRWEVAEFRVVSSVLGRSGSRYEPLGILQLTGRAP